MRIKLGHTVRHAGWGSNTQDSRPSQQDCCDCWLKAGTFAGYLALAARCYRPTRAGRQKCLPCICRTRQATQPSKFKTVLMKFRTPSGSRSIRCLTHRTAADPKARPNKPLHTATHRFAPPSSGKKWGKRADKSFKSPLSGPPPGVCGGGWGTAGCQGGKLRHSPRLWPRSRCNTYAQPAPCQTHLHSHQGARQPRPHLAAGVCNVTTTLPPGAYGTPRSTTCHPLAGCKVPNRRLKFLPRLPREAMRSPAPQKKLEPIITSLAIMCFICCPLQVLRPSNTWFPAKLAALTVSPHNASHRCHRQTL